MKKDQVLLQGQESLNYYIYDSLELTPDFLEELIEEARPTVQEEWERLVQMIVMYIHLIEEKSSLLITKETMSKFVSYLNMQAGLKVVKAQYQGKLESQYKEKLSVLDSLLKCYDMTLKLVNERIPEYNNKQILLSIGQVWDLMKKYQNNDSQ